MIQALFFLSLLLSISIWIKSTLRSEGVIQTEIKVTLKNMSKNIRELIGNGVKVLNLLIKDLTRNETKRSEGVTIKQQSFSKVTYLESELPVKEKEKEVNLNQEEDIILQGFSPEIIPIIEEENEKIA